MRALRALLDFLADVPAHPRRRRAGSLAVAKDVHPGEIQRLDKGGAGLEFVVGLAGEADDQVGRDAHVGDRRAAPRRPARGTAPAGYGAPSGAGSRRSRFAAADADAGTDADSAHRRKKSGDKSQGSSDDRRRRGMPVSSRIARTSRAKPVARAEVVPVAAEMHAGQHRLADSRARAAAAPRAPRRPADGCAPPRARSSSRRRYRRCRSHPAP